MQNLRNRVVQPQNNFVLANFEKTSRSRRLGIRMPGVSCGREFLSSVSGERKRKLRETHRALEVSPREVLVWGLPPSPTANRQSRWEGRSEVLISTLAFLNFLSGTANRCVGERRRRRRRRSRAGKATTYFNSSFPCEFLAWTYDQLLTPQLRTSRFPSSPLDSYKVLPSRLSYLDFCRYFDLSWARSM